VVEDLQLVARANLVFGLHIHVGIEDRNTAIHIMNSMRYFLPHILALSSNSPFWEGTKTGFKSYRSKVFERFPRTNIPDVYANWAEYETFINLLVKTNCVDNGKKVWWDIRPHPFFNTLEVRVCDIPMRLDETMAIAALIQATVGMLYDLHAKNKSYRIYGRALIMENKFRAARYGIDGKLIDFGREEEVPMRDLMLEYIDLDFRCSERTWLRARHRLHSRDAQNGHGRRPATQGLRRNRRPEEGCRLHRRGDSCRA
jgi:carboxylate-amine ligase